MKIKPCRYDWWNGFTHEVMPIPTPEGYPRSKIIEETPYAIRKKWFEYEQCVRCGKIFTHVSLGYWEWKDKTKEIQV